MLQDRQRQGIRRQAHRVLSWRVPTVTTRTRIAPAN